MLSGSEESRTQHMRSFVSLRMTKPKGCRMAKQVDAGDKLEVLRIVRRTQNDYERTFDSASASTSVCSGRPTVIRKKCCIDGCLK